MGFTGQFQGVDSDHTLCKLSGRVHFLAFSSFQKLPASLGPWALLPSSQSAEHFPVSLSDPAAVLTPPSLTLTPSSLFRMSCGGIGPSGYWPNTLDILAQYSYEGTSTGFPWPWKVTYLRVPEVRVWTCCPRRGPFGLLPRESHAVTLRQL